MSFDFTIAVQFPSNTGSVYFRKAYFTPIIMLKVIIPKDDRVDMRYLFHAWLFSQTDPHMETIYLSHYT